MSIRDRFRRGRGDHHEVMLPAYPLNRSQERTYPEDFQGDIFYWDIDKTYLATDFRSLRGLLTIPLEMAIDKRAIAGADTLLRALRRGTHGATGHPRRFNISSKTKNVILIFE